MHKDTTRTDGCSTGCACSTNSRTDCCSSCKTGVSRKQLQNLPSSVTNTLIDAMQEKIKEEEALEALRERKILIQNSRNQERKKRVKKARVSYKAQRINRCITRRNVRRRV